MDEEYDAIVLGTGLKSTFLCDSTHMISSVYSILNHRSLFAGKKVLHMDRNDYYGGASASLNLEQFYQRFQSADAKAPEHLGRPRDWNIDMIPKFIMANGKLVKALVHTDVTKYLEFKQVDGSFVFKDERIYKVPASDVEALKSSLMGFFEKRRCKKLFEFVQNYDASNPATFQGIDIHRMTGEQFYAHFGVDENTQGFIGHALALYREDSYLKRSAAELVDRIMIYFTSLMRYGKSPYIYPLYGLGELPQAFARLSAVYGGTYMLNKPVDSIKFDESGHVCGVESGGEVAKCKLVIADPSYFPDRVKKVGQVVRCIAFLDHPLESNTESVQIIIPQKQVNRHHDIYISCFSNSLQVCAPGKYVAFVSTTVETSRAEAELEPGLRLLGPMLAKFYDVYDLEEPNGDGTQDGVFVSRSYDATSHFETTMDDVMDIYKRAMGEELDLSHAIVKPAEDFS